MRADLMLDPVATVPVKTKLKQDASAPRPAFSVPERAERPQDRRELEKREPERREPERRDDVREPEGLRREAALSPLRKERFNERASERPADSLDSHKPERMEAIDPAKPEVEPGTEASLTQKQAEGSSTEAAHLKDGEEKTAAQPVIANPALLLVVPVAQKAPEAGIEASAQNEDPALSEPPLQTAQGLPQDKTAQGVILGYGEDIKTQEEQKAEDETQGQEAESAKGKASSFQGLTQTSHINIQYGSSSHGLNAAPDHKGASAQEQGPQATQQVSQKAAEAQKSVKVLEALGTVLEASKTKQETAKTEATGSFASLLQPSSSLESTQVLPKAPPSQAVPLHAVPIEIGMRAMAGDRSFEISLNPDDLGRIDVQLDISKEGEVKAVLSVERPETLLLLQRDAKTLERAFEQAGLKTSDNSLSLAMQDKGQQQNETNRNNQRSSRHFGAEAVPEIKTLASMPLQRLTWRSSGVDMII